MILFTLVGNFKQKHIPYHSVLIGAFFFVISQSFLALNKFHNMHSLGNFRFKLKKIAFYQKTENAQFK
jgi:hypothetical protein